MSSAGKAPMMPAVPVEIVKSDSASVQIASFIEQASQFWGLVNLIKVSRKRRGGSPGFEQTGLVRHITKGEEVVDDSKAVIEQFVAIARADADANGAYDYRISLWGQREQPKRGRGKVIADDSELLALTIRLGDGEAESGGEAGIMREVGQLLPKQASGFQSAISAAESALALQEKLLQVQSKIIEQTYEIHTKGAAQQVETLRLVLDARREERQEEREREKAERDEEREAAIEANRQATMQQFMGLLMFAAQLAAMKFAKETGQTPPTPPGQPPPQPGDLGPALGEVLGSLTPEESAKAQEIVGDRIWDLLKAAAAAPSDDETRAILHGLKSELKSHPNGKAAMIQLVTILGQERMARLAQILTAAGLGD